MAVKVGINGFGRIGRQVLKAIRDLYPEALEVVAFNDIGDLPTMAHLLKYDSNYGRFDGKVEVAEGALVVNGKSIKAFKETDPAAIPWGRDVRPLQPGRDRHLLKLGSKSGPSTTLHSGWQGRFSQSRGSRLPICAHSWFRRRISASPEGFSPQMK